ncbi:hypothetical protein M5K25_018322 [Dendrobium thyrsiflorum]|uniref:Uncharacterized protein n=1 Tax=Dendrobium thyrsiflorum TaxID=117978 RepID=A0ABD0UHP0_DENTH
MSWLLLYFGDELQVTTEFTGGGPSLKESRERSETALAPLLLLDHLQSSVEPPLDHHLKARRSIAPPPEGPTFCRTTPGRPDVLPDHHLKARHSAGPPHEGLMLCSRPDALLKARRSAQGPTFCSRPNDLGLNLQHSLDPMHFSHHTQPLAQPGCTMDVY